MKIFENKEYALYLSYFGMGRSSVLNKTRMIKHQSFKPEHDFFASCIVAMQKNGLTDTLNDERAKEFYSDFCIALSCPPGYARRNIFFNGSPEETAFNYI